MTRRWRRPIDASIDEEALNLLRLMVGLTAEFRDHQLDAITALVEARSRVLEAVAAKMKGLSQLNRSCR